LNKLSSLLFVIFLKTTKSGLIRVRVFLECSADSCEPALDSAARLVSALSGRDINARGCDDEDHSDEDETDEAKDAVMDSEEHAITQLSRLKCKKKSKMPKKD
jgi:hypothetical protein